MHHALLMLVVQSHGVGYSRGPQHPDARLRRVLDPQAVGQLGAVGFELNAAVPPKPSHRLERVVEVLAQIEGSLLRYPDDPRDRRAVDKAAATGERIAGAGAVGLGKHPRDGQLGRTKLVPELIIQLIGFAG